jgi:hypothetical protein
MAPSPAARIPYPTRQDQPLAITAVISSGPSMAPVP